MKMLSDNIKNILKKLTQHNFLGIVPRGNAAITSALSILPKSSTVLIPDEGGWIHYKKAPIQLGLKIGEVKCIDAKISLANLQEKIKLISPAAFLYQNPGGYFAQQPMKEIYDVCKKNKCLVILDVSGSIGTSLCDGRYADILVGSFGEWKLVQAKVGGFISCKDELIWETVKGKANILNDETSLHTILQQLLQLPQRIEYLQELRQKVILDLQESDVLYPDDVGFVVVVKYDSEKEKQELIIYCTKNKHHYAECPRYIRINQKAISIEIKREQP